MLCFFSTRKKFRHLYFLIFDVFPGKNVVKNINKFIVCSKNSFISNFRTLNNIKLLNFSFKHNGKVHLVINTRPTSFGLQSLLVHFTEKPYKHEFLKYIFKTREYWGRPRLKGGGDGIQMF